MRRLALSAAFVVLSALVLSIPAGAITYGEPDGDGHPYVGALVIETGSGKAPICSGTLIADDVFLTAAHCTAAAEDITGSDRAFVTFDPVVDPNDGTFFEGTMVTNPDYATGGQNDTGDIAVVLLDESTGIHTPVELPPANFLKEQNEKNGLKGQSFRNVGYGVEEPEVGPGGPVFAGSGTRRVSESTFKALENAWLHLLQTNANGNSGTCFGDSGGPQFLGDSDMIASITVTGDAMCLATNVTYRLDAESARSFLDEFVELPE